MRKIIYTLCLLIVSSLMTSSYSQDMLGLITSNNSGVARGYLNPAAISNSHRYLDISIINGDIFFANNYLFVPEEDYSLNNYIYFPWQAVSAQRYYDQADIPKYPVSGEYFLDRYDKDFKNLFFNMRINGPSAMLRYEEIHHFALQTSVRTMISAKDVPYNVAKFGLEGLSYTPQQNIRYIHKDPFEINTMSWAEVGLSYSRMLFEHWQDELAIGGTAKYLMGFQGLYFHSEYLDFQSPFEVDISINEMDGGAGIAVPINYYDNSLLNNIIGGHGVAFDLGASYTRSIRYQRNRGRTQIYTIPYYAPYSYRLGFSLLDIGFIKFSHNVRELKFDNLHGEWESFSDSDIGSVNDFIYELPNKFTADQTKLQTSNEFTMYMPMAASLQFDYNFRNNFFTQAIWIQDIPFLSPRVSRPSYLAVVPRFEQRRWEVAMPISLYNYREPRLGLSMRFYWLTLGADNLVGGLLGYNDFTGLDFYFSLQFGLDRDWREERARWAQLRRWQ